MSKFSVKPVWDKKRPKDLGEPKSLSVKKKKSAKARAAAAGRPYPNLIDNISKKDIISIELAAVLKGHPFLRLVKGSPNNLLPTPSCVIISFPESPFIALDIL
jgi:hypothetical protein